MSILQTRPNTDQNYDQEYKNTRIQEFISLKAQYKNITEKYTIKWWFDRQSPTAQTQRYKNYFTSRIRTCATVEFETNLKKRVLGEVSNGMLNLQLISL